VGVGDALAADAASRGDHLTTGIMGTRFLFDALTQAGHVDEAYKIAIQETYPSYGYWLDKLGWTGLGEYWEEDARSRNHQMYGSIVQWLYADLAGITPSQPGWSQITFKPFIPSGLDDVSASVDTVRGPVAIHWHQTPRTLLVSITVPPNATGLIYLPVSDPTAVTESGRPAPRAPGVRLIGHDGDRLGYSVTSGRYSFAVQR
jgi:alpha-L-rhamnosidase